MLIVEICVSTCYWR